MKSPARRLLVPTLLLFALLAAGAVAVGAFTNDDAIVAVPAQVAIPAQLGIDGGGGFLADAVTDAEIDALELPDMSLTDAAEDGGINLNPIPVDGPISLGP